MSSITRNIKLKIAYDGTGYAGWQIQNNQKTVQGTIENVLSRIHKHEVKLTGAGRTDAGVHARGQTANFKTDIASMTAGSFIPAINSLLPGDIRVLDSSTAAPDFNSRYDAVKRVYRYYVTDKNDLYPWQRNYSIYINKRLDINILNNLALPVTGVHDFSSFTVPLDNGVTAEREIFSSVFYYQYPFAVYEISGSGFLRKMVRSIVGTILELYRENRGPDDMIRIIRSRERSAAGPTSPSKGLFLDEVIYNETDN